MNQVITIDQKAAAYARKALLEWYGRSARSFPWRDDTDPYRILIAEMMLRRTQARQVVDVYNRFIDLYPDVRSLDLASGEEVAELLRPLGLSWRAANFKELAHELMTIHAGNVPRGREALLAL